MLRFGIIVLLLALVLVGVVAVIGLFVDPAFTVERSITISAAAEKISPLIESPRKWQEWTAWTKESFPEMETTYEGPETGVGAKSVWTDPKSMNGNMTITAVDSGKRIDYELNFDGFPTSTGYFEIGAADGGQRVTWRLDGTLSQNPFARLIGSFFVDSGIGGDFEKGLAKLKQLAESEPK